ncbi:MAG: FISUMP domain-containing protein [Ignavibacteriaceae bacterium]|nr:FISUMP domain-containing protein [Ignavibacteriaceae bacterium]
MKQLYIALLLLSSSISYSQSPCVGLDSLNYGSQWYHTVQIGSQCWLKENLIVGVMIPAVRDQINNDTIEKFCYNNDPAMCDIYGGLYQWREAVQYTQKQSPRGICPIGWHIPLTSEFDSLISAIGANGNALLQVGQGGGTNTSGFSGLLSGYDSYTLFGNNAINANFWSCYSFYIVHADPYEANYLELWNDNEVISGRHYNAEFGLSVRCIKDTNGLLLQAPYGGENWQAGSVHKISWGGVLTDKKIQVDYTTDNGISWINILGSASATDGDYNWTIPDTPSKNCRVKITDINNPNSFAISDTIFTIYTTCPGGSTIVHGGQIYHTIMIGNKCWFKENVNIGTMIPGSQLQPQDSILEKYCYNDDTANCSTYGGLYLFSEMNEPGFCPPFWHIPSYGTFDILLSAVLYDANALKAVGQGSGYGAGTNTSGFSALLAGNRNSDGTFSNLGNIGWFPYQYYLYPYKIDAYYLDPTSSFFTLVDYFSPESGGSARCVMDDIGPLTLKSPVGGENWLIGSTHKITWSFSNVINIRIDYTTNNGTSWINIIPTTPTSTGSFNWTVPNTPSTNCKVKISSTNSADTNSISNLFSIYQVPINPCPGMPTVTYAGQTYNTVAIGDQCWMRENLNIGSLINGTINQSDNGIIEKYCYNNDSVKCSIYGGLYQWDEAMQYDTTEGAKGICPIGWHVPTWNDFSILKTYVGNNSNDLKDFGQGSGSGAGTNASGFSALLAGGIYQGKFMSLGIVAVYWSSTLAYYLELVNNSKTIFGGPIDKIAGNSIRCINDSSVTALPVELISFTSSKVNNNVILNWNTATETNCLSYEVERRTSSSNTWQKIASIQASGNSNSPRSYSYIDKNVNSGNYNYRLRIFDVNGTYKYSSIIDLEMESPAKFSLAQNYPNPWNPTTTIRYQLPINTLVTIKIFDVLGKEIITLVNEAKPAGTYEVTLNSKNISSGIYYYQMRSGNFCETKKLILIK